MRAVAHGVVWFPNFADEQRVRSLMVDYCSARRSAYQALQRDLKTNDARKAVKKNYSHLGQRYINDAVSEAGKIERPHSLFGGKKSWKELQTGLLSKKDWRSHRNNAIYSRGDRTKLGNPNLRLVGDELWVNDPAKRGAWLKGKLWLNKPVDLECYETRIQYKDGEFKVTVSWDTQAAPVRTITTCGTIGLDLNPSGIALVETNKEGCILQQQFLLTERAQFAQEGKRSYDIRQVAIKIVDCALKAGKHLVIEKLKFKSKQDKGRRFNRMSHNFLHGQMAEAIKSRAARLGVGVIEVNPAFTSVIGELKYADHYSLSRHTAAALVIARLGLDLKKEVVRVKIGLTKKKRRTLEGRSRRIALSERSFSWMVHLFDVRPKPPGVTPPHPVAGNSAGQVVLVQPRGCEAGAITGPPRHEDDNIPY